MSFHFFFWIYMSAKIENIFAGMGGRESGKCKEQNKVASINRKTLYYGN